MHALIFEEDALVALSVEHAVGMIGFDTVDVATDLESAITHYERRIPDLLFAAYRWDDGWKCADTLAALASASVPTIYLITDPGQKIDRQKGSVVMEKPFTIGDLVLAVAEARADRMFEQELPALPSCLRQL
ncbi:hypothetical protein HMF7854_11140 [Sphingomonas ginkgonis]|uniref:Response regulatory domain-containing protein n=1 Tax=Sphingomonas ginkgonis TaxID=2315330 RepID=A0A3R9WQZ3_9SPHN|nr:hypothetical protein [Sphingomonas ginkgonis]RST31331.1 hypothetical protein HMF7854_11140 [Sphingomonas ginkgonis]